jgi:hypothetical protein
LAGFFVAVLFLALNQGSATLTSADLSTFLPIISAPDYMLLTIDPEGTPELVKITAYGGSGDTCTVDRGEEGTTDITHSNGAEWRCGTSQAGLEGLADGTLWPDDVVEARHLKDLNVLEAALNTGAVTTNKIGDGQVTDSKIGTISGSKLSDGSVTNAKLESQPPVGTGEITEDMLQSASVTNLKIGSGEVKGGNIGAGEIDNTHIGTGEIDNSHIDAAADIAGSKLLDGSIADAKLTSSYFPKQVTPVAKGGNFTPVVAEETNHFRISAAATVTIPLHASQAFPTGTQLTFFRTGTGAVTFAAEGAVTLNAVGLTIAGQYVGVMGIKVADDEWDLIGNLI